MEKSELVASKSFSLTTLRNPLIWCCPFLSSNKRETCVSGWLYANPVLAPSGGVLIISGLTLHSVIAWYQSWHYFNRSFFKLLFGLKNLSNHFNTYINGSHFRLKYLSSSCSHWSCLEFDFAFSTYQKAFLYTTILDKLSKISLN